MRLDVGLAARRLVALLARHRRVGLRAGRLDRRERLSDLVERAVLAVGERLELARRVRILASGVVDELGLGRRQRNALQHDLHLGCELRIHQLRRA